MVCMAIIHFNMNCESMDQTLDHCIQAQWSMLIFKAIKSHGTVSWIIIFHQGMPLINRGIETLCLEKRENVRSDNPILTTWRFPSKKRARKGLYEETMINNFALELIKSTTLIEKGHFNL